MRFALPTVLLGSLVATSCAGITTLPTAPSLSLAPAVAASASPVVTRTLPINGAVRPLGENNPACWADRYPCTIYEFTLAQEGPIDITLAWEGHPRALLVQLYWGDGAIAHEAVAPRDGPPQIAFVRPRMEASLYRVRVVSLEPAETIPYVLTIAY